MFHNLTLKIFLKNILFFIIYIFFIFILLLYLGPVYHLETVETFMFYNNGSPFKHFTVYFETSKCFKKHDRFFMELEEAYFKNISNFVNTVSFKQCHPELIEFLNALKENNNQEYILETKQKLEQKLALLYKYYFIDIYLNNVKTFSHTDKNIELIYLIGLEYIEKMELHICLSMDDLKQHMELFSLENEPHYDCDFNNFLNDQNSICTEVKKQTYTTWLKSQKMYSEINIKEEPMIFFVISKSNTLFKETLENNDLFLKSLNHCNYLSIENKLDIYKILIAEQKLLKFKEHNIKHPFDHFYPFERHKKVIDMDMNYMSSSSHWMFKIKSCPFDKKDVLELSKEKVLEKCEKILWSKRNSFYDELLFEPLLKESNHYKKSDINVLENIFKEMVESHVCKKNATDFMDMIRMFQIVKENISKMENSLEKMVLTHYIDHLMDEEMLKISKETEHLFHELLGIEPVKDFNDINNKLNLLLKPSYLEKNDSRLIREYEEGNLKSTIEEVEKNFNKMRCSMCYDSWIQQINEEKKGGRYIDACYLPNKYDVKVAEFIIFGNEETVKKSLIDLINLKNDTITPIQKDKLKLAYKNMIDSSLSIFDTLNGTYCNQCRFINDFFNGDLLKNSENSFFSTNRERYKQNFDMFFVLLDTYIKELNIVYLHMNIDLMEHVKENFIMEDGILFLGEIKNYSILQEYIKRMELCEIEIERVSLMRNLMVKCNFCLL